MNQPFLSFGNHAQRPNSALGQILTMRMAGDRPAQPPAMIQRPRQPERSQNPLSGASDEVLGRLADPKFAKLLNPMQQAALKAEIEARTSRYNQPSGPNYVFEGDKWFDKNNPASGPVWQPEAKPEPRKIIKGADGYNYYADSQERVLPDVVRSEPEATDDIREYQFAQQNGFEGSFSDFIRGNRRAGASSVNVSTGTGLPTPKAGFDYVPDGKGGIMRDERGMPIQAPIPGGPEDTSGDAASLAASASDSLALIDNVLNDPNLASVTGMIQGRLPARTQAQQDLLIRIEQLQGQAFLQAFETLKGGGQITEREGQAAQAAIARLQRPQSEDAYRQALTELRAIVARGAERAGGAAQQPIGAEVPTAGASSIPNGYSLLTPETWAEISDVWPSLTEAERELWR